MTKDEVLQMCLEYIETNAHERRHVRWAIKDALAEPTSGYAKKIQELIQERDALRALAQPEERPWVGLTEEELFEIMDKANTRYQAVQMTEAKLRELNELQIDPNQWAFDNGLEST